jgi:hypothetical protein
MKANEVLGLGSALTGLGLLLSTFAMGLVTLLGYSGVAPSNGPDALMGTLAFAAVRVFFLMVMGWVGSLLMKRGNDFRKTVNGAD